MEREIPETNPLQRVSDSDEGYDHAAELDQTVDSASRPVAVSADAKGMAVLGRLLEGKRGPIPSFETVKMLAQGGSSCLFFETGAA